MTQLLPGSSLGFLLTDLSRLYRQAFERGVEEAGLTLTPGEIRTVSFVARFPGSRQAVLAERMGIEPMTLSAYLDRLEAHGLIMRSPDPTDRRAKIINTTSAASAVFEQIRPIALDVFHHATRSIGPDELKAVEAILAGIRANLSGEAGLPVPMFQMKIEPAAGTAALEPSF